MPTWLVDHTLLLKGHRYLEARDLHWIKYRVLFKQQHHLFRTTDDFILCSPALDSVRTAPWVTVLAALTGTRGMFVYCLPSGCPVCGAFVAAVVAVVSLLAWAVRLLLLKCPCMFCRERAQAE